MELNKWTGNENSSNMAEGISKVPESEANKHLFNEAKSSSSSGITWAPVKKHRKQLFKENEFLIDIEAIGFDSDTGRKELRLNWKKMFQESEVKRIAADDRAAFSEAALGISEQQILELKTSLNNLQTKFNENLAIISSHGESIDREIIAKESNQRLVKFAKECRLLYLSALESNREKLQAQRKAKMLEKELSVSVDLMNNSFLNALEKDDEIEKLESIMNHTVKENDNLKSEIHIAKNIVRELETQNKMQSKALNTYKSYIVIAAFILLCVVIVGWYREYSLKNKLSSCENFIDDKLFLEKKSDILQLAGQENSGFANCVRLRKLENISIPRPTCRYPISKWMKNDRLKISVEKINASECGRNASIPL